MFELQLLVFLALGMEVNAADAAGALVEANVVETFKARSGDRFDSVIWNEKVLLPTHEKMLSRLKVFQRKIGRLCCFGQWSPRGKSCPVLHVYLFGAAPGWMCGLKNIFWSDDFAFEKSGQSGMIVSEPYVKYFSCLSRTCNMAHL